MSRLVDRPTGLDMQRLALKERKARAEGNASKIIGQIETKFAPNYPEREFNVSMRAMHLFLTEFTPVPRQSGHEELMSESFLQWAERNNFHHEQDTTGNVAAVIPGDPHLPVVVLHFHQDMVAVANPHAVTHPKTDGVEPEYLEADNQVWIQAKDGLTSLGADNGAGGAASMAVAEELAKEEDHGPIVLLGTVEEETTFRGAKHIAFPPDGEVLPLLEKADFIINDDMEYDNGNPRAVHGSYGFESFTINSPVTTEDIPEGMIPLTLSVEGLRGGHSGLYAERTNAKQVLLHQVQTVLGEPSSDNDWRLVSFQAGEATNSISNSGSTTIALPEEKAEAVREALTKLQKAYEQEETISLSHASSQHTQALNLTSTQEAMTILQGLSQLHGTNGTLQVGEQTLFDRSLNIGIVSVSPEKGLQVATSGRFGTDEEAGKYFQQVQQLLEPFPHVVVSDYDKHDIWPHDPTSILPAVVKATWKGLPFGKDENLITETITGGLELGALHKRFPKSQNITLGMWIDDIHKAGERINVQSFIENVMLLEAVTRRLSRGAYEALEIPAFPTRRTA